MPQILENELKNEPRWTRRKEDRPQEILGSALELFAKNGFTATRLDDVAKAAGVSKGTLYLYFKDKEEIFKKVVETGIIPNIEEMEKNIASFGGDENVEKVISLGIRKMVEVVTTTSLGAIPKIVISEAGNFPNLTNFYRDEVVVRIHMMMANIIQKGIDQGHFRNVSVFDAARSLLSTIFMMMITLNMPGFKEKLFLDIDLQIETTLDIWFRGMRAND